MPACPSKAPVTFEGGGVIECALLPSHEGPHQFIIFWDYGVPE
jgi:hypothetical protein